MSKLSDLSSETTNTEQTNIGVEWDTKTEEQRQDAFNEVKATVDSGDTDLDDYKNAYKDAFEQDTTLADDDIIWAIAQINDDDTDAIVLVMKTMEDSGVSGDEADTDEALLDVKSKVTSLADKLASDADFKAEMDLILVSKEIVDRGPVSTLLHLERIWDSGDWAMVPEPGSKMPTKDKPSNITIWDITPTKRGNRKINISWYTETARVVNPKLFDDAADMNETFKSADERQLNNPQRREFIKLPPLKRRALSKTFNSRCSRFADLLKRAVRVRTLRATLKDLVNKDGKHPIGCEYAWDVHPIKANNYKGVLLPGNAPILVYDALTPIPTEKVGEAYTVTTFLKFDAGVKKMLASGADPSFTELDDTLGRNREAMAAQKRTNRYKVEGMEDALFSLASIANYFDNAENLRMYKKHLETKKKKNDDGADPRLMTEYEMEQFQFGETMMKIMPIWSYVKASGFDDLWEANKRGEKLTSDDILTLQDEALAAAKRSKVA